MRVECELDPRGEVTPSLPFLALFSLLLPFLAAFLPMSAIPCPF